MFYRAHFDRLEEPKYLMNLFVLQECVDFTWRVSDCEGIVGQVTITIINTSILHNHQ